MNEESFQTIISFRSQYIYTGEVHRTVCDAQLVSSQSDNTCLEAGSRLGEESSLHVLNGLLNRIGNFKPYDFLVSFSSRLIFQKTIYFLQSFGIYLGYHFSWYIHGPYSVDLTRAGYKLAEGEFDDTATVHFSKKSSAQEFEVFLRFLGDRKEDSKWLEIVASLHFLRKLFPEKTRREITLIIRGKQDYLSSKEITEAWDYLERFNLLS